MKRIAMFLLLFSAVLFDQAFSDEIDHKQYVLGYWGTSETSFEKADTSGEYIEVKEDGTLRFFELTDEGEEDRMEFNWEIEDNNLSEKMSWYFDNEILSIESDDSPIIKTIVIFTNNNMIWDRKGKLLYLIPKGQ